MDATTLSFLPNDVNLLKQLVQRQQLELTQYQLERQEHQQQRQYHTLELQHREAQLHEQQTTIAQLQREKEGLAHRIEQLLRRLYGRSSERIDAQQLLLFGQAMSATAAPDATPSRDAASASRRETVRGRGHGRRPLPADLPRHRIEHPIDPAQMTCTCCGQERVRIGEVVSEQLEYAPASLFVLEHVRPKYACKQCEEAGVVTADKPAQVIDKGLPGPGLVAQVAVSKFCDHLPLYRLERIFARHGVMIARSTMCNWMGEAAKLLAPLHELMCQRVRQSKVIHTDDTTLPVQDPGTRAPGSSAGGGAGGGGGGGGGTNRTKTGRLWVYVGDETCAETWATPTPGAPTSGGGGGGYTVFEYTPSRSRDGPVNWLKTFSGYLQADAFGGYDGIYARGDGAEVIEVACWAHARRKFYDARLSDPARAFHVLGVIRVLYQIEKQARDEKLDAVRITALRQAKALPLLNELGKWLQAQQNPDDGVLPKSPMGQAVQYALNQWDALLRYTRDGRLSIDNNAAERAIRPLTIGRKNYLFAGNDRGGRTAATLYSFIASAKRHQLDPFAYLRDVLARIGATPRSQLDQFLPDRWQPQG